MIRPVRARFWVECVTTFLSGSLAAVTMRWPTWIESLFGARPDGGSGSLEWLVVAALVAVAAAFSFLARREWRHAPAEPVVE